MVGLKMNIYFCPMYRQPCIKCNREDMHYISCCYYNGFCNTEKCRPFYKKICPLRNKSNLKEFIQSIKTWNYPELEDFKIKKLGNCAETLESKFIPEIRLEDIKRQKDIVYKINDFPIIAISIKNFLTLKAMPTRWFIKAKEIGLKNY